jgi:hypothetical protein
VHGVAEIFGCGHDPAGFATLGFLTVVPVGVLLLQRAASTLTAMSNVNRKPRSACGACRIRRRLVRDEGNEGVTSAPVGYH